MAKAKRLMASAALTALFLSVSASAQEATVPFISDFTNPGVPMEVEKDQISEFEPLVNPFTHAVTLHGREGIAFISENGRFILRGVMFDTWNGETIQTIDALRASKRTLNIGDLGFEDKDLDPMYFGTGPKTVTVFVDPLCPFCAQLFDQVIGDPTLARDYTFKIFTVPFLGEASVQAVTRLSCAQNRQEATQALLTKDRRWLQTVSEPENCDPQPIMQRTIMSQMLGVTGVPYLIGVEGGVSRGMPVDLKTFLATN